MRKLWYDSSKLDTICNYYLDLGFCINYDNLHISKQEIIDRKKSWIQPKIKASSGSLFKYANVVSSASKGCVTDEFN